MYWPESMAARTACLISSSTGGRESGIIPEGLLPAVGTARASTGAGRRCRWRRARGDGGGRARRGGGERGQGGGKGGARDVKVEHRVENGAVDHPNIKIGRPRDGARGRDGGGQPLRGPPPTGGRALRWPSSGG